MSKWPGKFFRVTNHTPPRYQLYYPGFNLTSGCWLFGSWVTLPKEGWEELKDQHQKMFQDVPRQAKKQKFRHRPLPLRELTAAQRKAWEHFSGSDEFDVREVDGSVGVIRVDMAGVSIKDNSQKWMRERGSKILEWIISSDRKKKHQTKGFDIPEDLVEKGDSDHPVDVWKNIVAQNLRRMEDTYEAYLLLAEEGGEFDIPGLSPATLAIHLFHKQEETIIRAEWEESKGRPDPYLEMEQEIARYRRMRARLRRALGDNFDTVYEESRLSHNEEERDALDCGGLSFVLPKFHDDGTHEPWGPGDVPKKLP